MGDTHRGVAGVVRPSVWIGPLATKTEPVVGGVETMDDVLSIFSDPGRYRNRLAYIAQYMCMISHAWSEPSLPDPDATLGVIQDMAKSAPVPPGCERAQETLMGALCCYQEARRAFQRARENARPAVQQAAWDHIRDGYVLLSLAQKLAEAA
jgi:hypothetical protein